MNEVKDNKKILDFWTMFKVWYLNFHCIMHLTNYPRYHGIGLACCLLPALKKLYKDKPEEIMDAMKVYGEGYYLSEPSTGCSVTGIILSMEAERAAGKDITRKTINNVKTGLMGGLTGFGDTIFTATLRPLAMAICTPMAIAGNPAGPILFMLFKAGARAVNSIFWLGTGYKLGKNAVGTMLAKGRGIMDKFIEGTVVLSMVVMGGMVCDYVKPQFALEWTSGETTKSLQELLDSILPGILPLATVFLIYYLLQKRKMNVTVVILIFLAISLVGTLLGIFK